LISSIISEETWTTPSRIKEENLKGIIPPINKPASESGERALIS